LEVLAPVLRTSVFVPVLFGYSYGGQHAKHQTDDATIANAPREIHHGEESAQHDGIDDAAYNSMKVDS
jgi:hypothetical protein